MQTNPSRGEVNNWEPMVVVTIISQIQALEIILEPTQSNHYLVTLVILTCCHEDEKLDLEMMIFCHQLEAEIMEESPNPFMTGFLNQWGMWRMIISMQGFHCL